MRFLILVGVMLVTFFVLSRSQVNEHARLITRSGAVYEGTIVRDFVSADFIAKTPDGVHRVPQDQFRAMAYEGSAISTPAAWLGALAIMATGIWAISCPGRRRRRGGS